MNFKQHLNFDETIQFINQVVDTVTLNSGTEEFLYLPELYMYSYGLALIHFYTNFDISLSTEEENYNIIINTLNQVENGDLDASTLNQINYIKKAIDEKIEFRKSEYLKNTI